MNKNYKTYLKDQIIRAESKWGRKSYYEDIFLKQLKESWKSVSDLLGEQDAICCMGIRSGSEMFAFKEYYPKAQVYGIDITENIRSIRTARIDVKILIQDFNKLPDDWTNKFTLIFSNSLDHAFDPKQTIKEWHRITRNKGHLFLEFSTTPANRIEHSFNHRKINQLFPKKMFEKIKMWDSPDRNMITGVFRVIK